MIRNTEEFFDQVEDFCLNRLDAEAKTQFEAELELNDELKSEVQLTMGIQEAITDNDMAWIRENYNSESFQNILKRHVEINKELEHTPVGEIRSKLVKELFSLLDCWK